MYRLLIVDDEPLVRLGLQMTIDWDTYGITIVGVATNGKEGLDLVLSTKPDIIISDIKMPIMDGLELVNALKELKNDALCIILSGYKDFEYAKNTLENGAFAYLLKPISNDKLIECVLKAIKALDEKRQEQKIIASVTNDLPLIKNTIIQQLIAGNYQDIQETVAKNDLYELDIPQNGYVIFGKIDQATSYNDSEQVKQAIQALYNSITQELSKEASNQTVGIIYYSHFVILTSCANVVEMCEKALTEYERKHTEVVSLGISSTYSGLDKIYESYLKARKNAKSKLLLTMNSIATDDHEHLPYRSTVIDTIRYISKNYQYALNINMISYDLGVSASHLMHVFKEDMGQTVNDFLNEYRILMAQKLLASRKYRIYEVANHVGISDSKYFSQVFKKIVGVTPAEYTLQTTGKPYEDN